MNLQVRIQMVTSEIRESSHSHFVQIVMISQDFRQRKFLDLGQNKSEIVAKLTIGSRLACIHRLTDEQGRLLIKHERSFECRAEASRVLSTVSSASIIRPTS